MKRKFIVLIVWIVCFNCSKVQAQDKIIENKSSSILEFNIEVLDTLSNNLKDAQVKIYYEDSLIQSHLTSTESGLKLNLYIQNRYKLIVSKESFETFVFDINTEMSDENEENGKYGWEFNTSLVLKKNSDSLKIKTLIICFDSLIGYFDYCEFKYPCVNNIDEEQVFTIVDSMPKFPGGDQEMYKYMGKNIFYPIEAKANDEQGKVYVNFIVGKDGCIHNAKVIKGVSSSLDKEALRLINSMPKWTPGYKEKEAVNVSINLPISFVLLSQNNLRISTDNYKKGLRFYKSGDYNKAIEYFSVAIENYSRNVDAYFNRGISYYKMNNIEKACYDWKKAKSMGDKEAENIIEKYCK